MSAASLGSLAEALRSDTAATAKRISAGMTSEEIARLFSALHDDSELVEVDSDLIRLLISLRRTRRQAIQSCVRLLQTERILVPATLSQHVRHVGQCVGIQRMSRA